MRSETKYSSQRYHQGAATFQNVHQDLVTLVLL
jgi:hypothetical protein